GYETAYEVALGGSLQDVITETERDAKAAIELLKRTRGGRATFLPLNMMKTNVSPMLKDLVGKNGVLGLGNSLIKFDKKYSPAIDSLLGRVLVAENIDAAIAASKKAIGWSKIVTLEGELVLPSGAMTGGHIAAKTVNILGRKQEIEALTADVREIGKRATVLQDEGTALGLEADALAADLAEVEERDTAQKMSLLETERQLEFAGRDAKRLRDEAESLAVEKGSIDADLRKALEAEERLSTAVASADKENVNLDDLMARTDGEVRALQSEHDSLMAEINGVSVEAASLTQKRLGAERTLENLVASERELTTEIVRKREQLAAASAEKTETGERRVELDAELVAARKACEETQGESEQWKKTKQSILTASMEVNERAKDLSRKRDELTQRVHAAELKEARLEVQIAQCTARLEEEYEIGAEEALATEPQVERGSATEVMRLRREIRGMGEVNTGAVQEYARLTERFEFLSAQRQDLFDAKSRLVQAIREIDESTRGVFMETFEAVQAAFSVMFERLFGGGKTELILTEPEDILETGIDVVVELPGKKRQNLHLLSGGERALTASALMFALMFVRPSPFCVLDEVDAPLDEANVERFADVIKDFAERSQMIVITHNKSTMEKADILYGVTMQEPGISTLVSVKLN
ncbi:MAG: coiled-coil domain-containing protein, partial [Armatimonadota bacterium]